MITNEPNEGNDNTDKNKNGDIKRGTKKSINKKTGKKPLFKKKKNLLHHFF